MKNYIEIEINGYTHERHTSQRRPYYRCNDQVHAERDCSRLLRDHFKFGYHIDIKQAFLFKDLLNSYTKPVTKCECVEEVENDEC